MIEADATVDYDPFATAELTRVIPATAAQTELWMAARMGDAVSCSFNESISLRLEGELNEGDLRVAWKNLLARHESLRATFSPDDGRLCIAETGHADFEREDLERLTPAQQQERIKIVLAEEVETPFDLENGPLVRARLLRLGAGSLGLLSLLTTSFATAGRWPWRCVTSRPSIPRPAAPFGAAAGSALHRLCRLAGRTGAD